MFEHPGILHAGSESSAGVVAGPRAGRTVDHVELATAEWVDWFNHQRLYEYCGDIPPAALEARGHSAHTRA